MPKVKRKELNEDAEAGSGRQVSFGPLTDYLGYALRRAQMAAVAEFLEAFKEGDLRATQFAVLIIISENPGVRQTEGCDALGIPKANFVPLLKEVERRRLAPRQSVPAAPRPP